MMWTLEAALKFIRSIQKECFQKGYNVSLGGGVLNNGQSNHDLDIVVAPAKGQSPNPDEFLRWITSNKPLFIFEHKKWNDKMILVRMDLLTHTSQKVDLFIVL